MNAKYIGIGIIGIIVLIAIIFGVMYLISYNTLVSLDQEVNSKWSEVENQYQRQADLIPNLTSVVSSAVSVETKFVKDVIDARTKWLNAKTQLEKDTAGVEMNASLANFVSAIATNEAYPTLQANKQYTTLTDELAGTQNRITTARGRFIEAIQTYNTTIKSIPYNFFAGMFGYAQKEYYTASPGALTTPNIGNGTLPE